MSTVRIQIRRGLASEWSSVNPILAEGEMGVESDTNLFKFGNGSSTWTALPYANNSDVAIGEISQDAINAALVMGDGLTKTYNDGANTITLAVADSYFTELAQDAVDSALVAGTGLTKTYDDSNDTITVAVDNTIATKTYVDNAKSDAESYTDSAITTEVTNRNTAITEAVDAITTSDIEEGSNQYFTNERAQDAIGGNVGNGLSYNDADGSIYVNTNIIQQRVANVSDTEIGYLNGVTDLIQSQIDTKAPAASPTITGTMTAADINADSLTLSGNLIVNGTNTIINTETVKVEDNEIILNANVTGAPATSAFLTVNRGTSSDAKIIWNETSDKWELTSNGGINTYDIATTTDIDTHNSDTTNVHGIANTANLTTKDYVDSAIDSAKSLAITTSESYTDDEIVAHNSDTTNVHGISNTSLLATKSYADNSSNAAALAAEENAIDAAASYTDSAISTHSGVTTNIHGIGNTADLATKSYVNTAISNTESYADGAVSTHNLDTTNVHGITDTTQLATLTNVSDAKTDAESYTDDEIIAHNAMTSGVHGISDTSALATKTYVDNAKNDAESYADGILLTHNSDTTNVHGIADTSLLATKQYADDAVSAHDLDTTSVHGIADTTQLATKSYADNAVSTHNSDTTGVHGISDTSKLVTTDDTGTVTSTMIANGTIVNADISSSAAIAYGKLNLTGAVTNADLAGSIDQSKISNLGSDLALKAPLAGPTFTGTVVLPSTTSIGNVSATEIGYVDGVTSSIQTQLDAKLASATAASTYATIASPTFTGTVSGVTKSMVGLGNVDNTSDANKPVSTATQSALDLKAPLASPTFTGTVSGITKSMVGLGNVDNTTDANKPISTATQTALDLKAPLASPTFTGTTTAADVTITGNLTVSGTTTTVDSQNLAVTDSLIYLAKNQYSADALDIGIYGAYGAQGNNGGNHPHTGLVRDASDGKWKLISGGAEPSANEVDFTTATKDTLVIGALDATSATIGNVSNTELQYLDGVTSAIQTQLDAKAPLASPTFTGTVTLPANTVTNTMLAGSIASTKISGTAVTQADTGTVTNTMLAGSIAASKISGTAITASDTGTVTSTMILDGTIVNADINASAAIDQSKISGLTTALAAKAPTAAPTFTGLVTVSSSGVAFTDGTQTQQGVPSQTTIVSKSANFNITDANYRDNMIEVGAAATVTVTADGTNGITYPVGTSIDLLQTTSGQVTVTGTGATVNGTPGLKLRAQWSSATLFKRSANTWVLIGDLSA